MNHSTGLLNAPWNTCSLAIVIALTSYITLVRLLRYQRMRNIEAPFLNGKRALSSMTADEAFNIIKKLQELEFPYAFAKARRMALLKVSLNHTEAPSQSFILTSIGQLGRGDSDHVQALRCHGPEQ